MFQGKSCAGGFTAGGKAVILTGWPVWGLAAEAGAAGAFVAAAAAFQGRWAMACSMGERLASAPGICQPPGTAVSGGEGAAMGGWAGGSTVGGAGSGTAGNGGIVCEAGTPAATAARTVAGGMVTGGRGGGAGGAAGAVGAAATVKGDSTAAGSSIASGIAGNAVKGDAP